MSLSFLQLSSLFALSLHFFAAHGQTDSAPSSGFRYGGLSGSLPVELGLTSWEEDSFYTVDVALGGQNFTVILDTGSSDLWVSRGDRHIQYLNTTNLATDSTYAIGEVKGDVMFAELRVGPYVIPQQAFIDANSATDQPDVTQGILGMAFDTANLWPVMDIAWGRNAANKLGLTPMTNLIAQNSTAPGFFDLQLTRTYANGTTRGGHFLIGQHVAGKEAVTTAPKLERIGPYHWVVPLDGANINGKPFAGWNKSGVDGTPEGKVAVALDSGYTTSAFPKELIDSIYGSIPGAIPYSGSIPGTDNNAGQDNWIIPCNASANVSFVFAGQEFPVHPLDVVMFNTAPAVMVKDGISVIANATICTNRFSAGPNDTTYDFLLGMGFLRNVYASFQYGNYTPPGGTIIGQKPYVQLLSVTEPETAWAEYYEHYEQKVVASGLSDMGPAAWVKFLADIATVDGSDSTSSTSTPSTATTSSTSSASPAPSTTTAGPPPRPTHGNDESQDLEISGAVDESNSSSASTGSASDSKKYGPVVLGLLGANVAVGFIVLVVALTLCVRGVKAKDGGRYKPLRLPKETGGVDPERAALYND